MSELIPHLRILTPASVLPVTVAECKAFAHIDHDAEDALITNTLLPAAVEWLQSHGRLARTLLETRWRLTLDYFPSKVWSWVDGQARGREGIMLPRPPLITVESVKYYDAGGTQQTLSTDDYLMFLESEPAFIYPSPGKVWPVTQSGRPEAVEVIYTAGYTHLETPEGGGAEQMVSAASDVPAGLKLAVMLLVASWYRVRDSVGEVDGVTLTSVESLIGSFWDGMLT